MKSAFFVIFSTVSGLVHAASDPLADWVITPGPGMPSLEAVGLSKEKLHKMSLEEMTNPGTHVKARAISRVERSSVLRRDNPLCVPDWPAEESCALWCILYLHGLGDTQCVASQGVPYWCSCRRPRSTGAAILGVAPAPSSVSTSCRDVADALSWVPNNAACHFNGQCGGGYGCVGGAIVRSSSTIKVRGNIQMQDIDNQSQCIEGVNSDKCVL